MPVDSCTIVSDSAKPLTVRSAAREWRADPLRTLAERASAGDERALETLLLELGSSMLRTVRKVLGAHHPNVEDVTQEAALGFVKSLGSFRGDCTVTHFAVRIALRTALNARRHMDVRRRVGDFSSMEEESLDSSGASPLEIAISRERRRLVRSVLDQLIEPIAEALALHFMLGFTVSEIAGLQDVSPNTVWSRLKLGKRSLQKALAEDDKLGSLMSQGDA